jgi:molybdopterin converting factor subunit 1
MQVEIRLFARARELLQVDRLALEVPDGTTVESLRRRLATEYPQLRDLLARSAIALEDDFADDRAILQPGVRIAILPPVSGGS